MEMEILYVVVALFFGIVFWVIMKPNKNKQTTNVGGGESDDRYLDDYPVGSGEIIIPGETHVETPQEVIGYELPVENDPEPTPEMPPKESPVNCQLANFPPSPLFYEYYDCCGVQHTGEGFGEFEKRGPVSININLPFVHMYLTNEEAQQDC